MSGRTAAFGLDLGSTRFKAGLLSSAGELHSEVSRPAPELRRRGGRCEGDAGAYVSTAARLLDDLGTLPGELAGGLSSQRSTFMLERTDGRTASPLISWQDTRAADWCRAHRGFEAEFHALSGLMLSAHYVGPKLAAIAAGDPVLGDGLRGGSLRLRLLDGLLIEHLGGRPSTDPTMAARTGLYDIDALDWSGRLCERFGVHPGCLPEVRPTDALACPAGRGGVFRASLADQSASLVALAATAEDTMLINLGTGAFVLRATGEASPRLPGYLTGIVRSDAGGAPRYALEGAISGSGPAIDRYRVAGTRLGEDDDEPDLFAVPDGAGLGAPHWRPDIALTFSRPAVSIGRAAAHRALLEGLLFRLRRIHDDLGGGRRVLLAGGLSREDFLAQGLATLLDCRVERIDAAEATLYGAALAAAGPVETPAWPVTRFRPSPAGAYLAQKYERWCRWLERLLAGA